MSAHEWKPGDVALIPFSSREEVAIYTIDGWVASSYPRVAVKEYSDIRPLVVIDPEDREQVERLAESMLRNDRHDGRPCYSTTCHTDRLAQSLRDFAIEKPDEPTGLGAVVEDVHGMRWTRSNDSGEWFSADGDEVETEYARVLAIRILSEGVQA